MARLISQRKAVKPPNKLTDDRWKYLGLGQAQPNLGNAPTNNEGYTLKTDGQGKTTFDNTLGKLSFANSTVTNTQQTDIVIDNRGNGKIILSPQTEVQLNGNAEVIGNTQLDGTINVLGDNPRGTFPIINNVLYVNENGDDANDGRGMDPNRAKRTISGAVKSPYYQVGTTIKVASGHYFEDNPIPLKASTCVIGDDLRTTFIEPLNKDDDLFHVNSGVYIAQMAMINLRKGSVERYAPGGAGTYTTGAYAVAFPPKLTDPIDVKYSPYIQNATNQSGPWLWDGTMFLPNQTVQVPLGAGTASWSKATSTVVVSMSTGTVSVGMAINDYRNNGFENSYKLLQKNKAFLQAETIAYITNKYPTFVYDKTTCSRDVGLILNAVAGDARTGGNLRSREAGLAYWSGTYSLIQNEQTQTIDAISHIKTLASKIITNTISTATYQSAVTQVVDPLLTGSEIVASRLSAAFDVVTNLIGSGPGALPAPVDPDYGLIFPSGLSADDITIATTITNITSTATGYANAQILLQKNKSYIQKEVVEYVNQTYPTFVYPQDICFRDVGLIVDAISIDAAIGGNIQSRIAGLSYYTGSVSNIPGEVSQTVAAINYINTLAQQIIANNTVTSLTTATQYISSALTSATVASNNISNSINLITDIITNGPLADPGPVYPLLDQYVVTLSTASVAGGTSSTIYFGYTTVYPVQDKDIPQEWVLQRALNPQGSGGGALVDGNAPSPRSPIQSFVFDAFTQLNQGGIGIHIINNGYAQLVSVFTIFCDVGVMTENGGICSITNSNANFGNYSLWSKGYGRLEFSGLVWNPKFPTNVPNGQYYPLGYWPQNGSMEVYIPDLVNRPHIALIMEVEPPSTYIDYTGTRVPYVNAEGFPGYLGGTSNASALTVGAYSIDNIDTTGIAVGHKLYIRDVTGSQTGDNGKPYVLADTSVVDVGFRSVTLDQPIQDTSGDGTNDLYFNLYFCGNAYYTVLSSQVDNTVPQKDTVSWVDTQQEETSAAIRYARDITNKIITNTTVTNTYQTGTVQTFNATYTGGENAVAGLTDKFNIVADMIQYGQLTAPTVVKNTTLKSKDSGVLNAAKLLENNKRFIQEETVAFVDKEFVGFNYDQTKCYRDTGLIVDSIATDLLFGGTTQSSFAGLQYWNQNGYTGQIPAEITTTTNAIRYVQDLATRVVRNITTGTRYQSTVTQVTSTATDSSSTNLIKTDFDVIINILTSGTAGVTDLIVPNGIQSTNTNVIHAYNLLQANKRYIQTEAIAWVESNKPTSFIYDRTTCRRDTSLIVDAMVMDTVFPTSSNSQATFAGLQYWNQSGYTGQILKEITTTTAAFNYMSSIAQQIVQNITTGTRYQNTLTQVTGPVATSVEANLIASEVNTITRILTSGTSGVTDLIVPNGIEASTSININRAYTLLQENKSYIIAETISYIDAVKTVGFAYDKALCARDTGYLLDSICFDMLYGGNRQAIQSAVYYFNYTNSTAIPGESTQTVAAFNFIKSISRQIVQNTKITPYQTVVPQVTALTPGSDSAGIVFGQKIDTVTRIITSGTSVVTTKQPISLVKTNDNSIINGAKVLLANKEFIKAEVIAYLDQTFSYYYDPAKCYRDVGFMIDSVSFDLLHGGNRQAIHSGVYYYGFDDASSAIEGQRQETQFAYDHIIDLTNKIIVGNPVTITYQSTITQVLNLPTGTIDQVAEVAQKINTITNIIAQGPGVAPDGQAIPLRASTSTDVINAYNMILANKEFIQAETLAFVNASFNDFTYDSVKCARDTGIILDGLAIDLLYQGTSQSNFAGLQYWNQTTLTESIAGELTTTTNAIRYVQDLAKRVVQNITTGTRYQNSFTQVTNLPAANVSASNVISADFDVIVDILNNGTNGVTDRIVANGSISNDANITKAYALLQANKAYIQNEAIAYVEATKTGGFQFDRDTCARDVGYILDGVYYDVALGSNYNAVTSGLAYQRGITSSENVINQELAQTVSAITYAKTKTALLLSGSSTAVSRSNAAFDETLTVIQNGTSSAATITFPSPVGGSVNYDHARDLLQANKLFMQKEITAWIAVQVAGNLTPFASGFSYDVAKCERDVGNVVDALCYDIMYGTNWASVIAARAYFTYAVSVLPANQRPQSVAAFNRLKTIAQQIVQLQGVTRSAGNTQTQNVSGTAATSAEATTIGNLVSIITNVITANDVTTLPNIAYPSISWATSEIKSAVANLANNKSYIIDNTVQNTRLRFSSFFNYNEDNCFRDTGLIVDSVAMDLLYSGTSQSAFAGLQYWNQKGYTGAIAQELTTTTNAILHMKGIIDGVVNAAGGSVPQVAVDNNFNILLDILNNGTAGVTDRIVPNGLASSSTNFINAYNAIQTVKGTVIDSTISWIDSNNPTFSYTTSTCRRDLGYIIDSVTFDLLHGGNRQSVMSGVYYYGFDSTSTVVVNEMPQTTAAYNYIKAIVGKIVTGTLITNPRQPYVKQVVGLTTATSVEAGILLDNLNLITDIINQGPSVAPAPTPISLTMSSSTATFNAYNLLMANRDFIQEEVIAYTNSEFIGPAYDRTKCRRDTGLIVDALTQDLLFGGTSQSNFAGLQYWSQNGYTGKIGSELSTTTNAINYISNLAQRIVLNDTSGIRYPSGVTQKTDLPPATQAEADLIAAEFALIIDILNNGTDGITDRIVPNSITSNTSTHVQNAFALLEANKVYLQTQTLAFVENNKQAGFSYDQATCYRDTAYIIDSVAFDILYGGNRQAVQSGVYYYSFNADQTVVENEINLTTAAYDYIKTLATNIVTGNYIENPYQTIVSQVLSNEVGTSAESDIIGTNVDLITDIIANGPSVALDKTPIGLTPNQSASVKAAAQLLYDNKEFIIEELIAYINYNFGGFQYDKTKCYRDVGYILDSVSFDLLHGGNRQAIQSGVYYYTFNKDSTAIPNEIPQTVAAYGYLKTLVSNVITGTAMPRVYQTSTSQIRTLPATIAEGNSAASKINQIINIISEGPGAAGPKVPVGLTPSNAVNVTKAYNLLLANKQFIINELIGYINSTFVRFSYNKEKCYRDTGAILDAVIYDVLWGGNYRSVNTGNGYFSRKGRYHIVNLEENTQDPLDFIDGSTVNFYQRSYQSASGYLFEYIGAGTNYSALPQIGRKDPIQAHETVQLNNGKVFFTSTDQNGDFRIGPGLVISQATGVLYGRTFQKSLYAEMTPFILVVGA